MMGTGEPNLLLSVSRTNAKGTTGSAWKKATVDFTISPSTVYWIAIQLDVQLLPHILIMLYQGGLERHTLILKPL